MLLVPFSKPFARHRLLESKWLFDVTFVYMLFPGASLSMLNISPVFWHRNDAVYQRIFQLRRCLCQLLSQPQSTRGLCYTGIFEYIIDLV